MISQAPVRLDGAIFKREVVRNVAITKSQALFVGLPSLVLTLELLYKLELLYLCSYLRLCGKIASAPSSYKGVIAKMTSD